MAGGRIDFPGRNHRGKKRLGYNCLHAHVSTAQLLSIKEFRTYAATQGLEQMILVSEPIVQPLTATPSGPTVNWLQASMQSVHCLHVGSGLHVPSLFGSAQRFQKERDWRLFAG